MRDIYLKFVFQDAIHKSERNVADHSQYQDAYQSASDWLSLVRDRLASCIDTTGDKHTLTNKLDRIQVSVDFPYS